MSSRAADVRGASATGQPPVGVRRRWGNLAGGLVRFAVLAGGGLLLGIVVFDSVIMPHLTGHGAEAQVPDLIGRTLEHAQSILDEEGLQIGQVTEHFSSVYPDGYVVRQHPEPLRLVKRGHVVDIAVSFGREGLSVPDLRGVSYREAQVSLSRTGLALGKISHAYSDRVKRDEIVATAPEGGALAAPGTTVDLLVSLGPPAVVFLVPDLRGRRAADVRSFFERSGIRLVEVPVEGDYGAPPGEIVGQRPAPGHRIHPSDVLEVDVSAAGRGRW